MRVTAETKQKTRETILRVARKLFSERGFEQTTTRDLAQAAGVAAGTLFNYFPSKESLAMTIIAEALDEAKCDYLRRRRGSESLDEDLFLCVMTGLRRLEPHRNYVSAAIETALSPFARSSVCPDAERVRVEHVEQVAERLEAHGITANASPITMHLYWSLYLGVLAFWARDSSPNQEDTLVLLDRSMRLFVASLTTNSLETEVEHGT